MSESKFFNAWIKRNFKGLSAHTLAQFLRMEGYIHPYVDDLVYVTLFNYATKKDASEDAVNAFIWTRDLVANCEWL